MYQRILVPLDRSTIASDVLPHVRELVRCTHAQVSLLQVTPAPVYSNETVDANTPRWTGTPVRTLNSVSWQLMSNPSRRSEQIEHQVEAAQHHLDAVADELAQSGIQARTLVKPDAVAQTILDTADSERADLIVMTTRSQSGVGRFLMGSIADRVVHDTRLPVLLIRAKPASDWTNQDVAPAYKRLLVPLDGSALSYVVLDEVRELALCADAEVLLLRVIPELNTWVVGEVAFGLTNRLVDLDVVAPQAEGPVEPGDTLIARRAEHARETAQQSLDAAAADLKRAGVRVETLLQVGQPAETILEVAANCHADMIALTTHGRSGVTRFLMGGVARRIVEHADVPVLLVRKTR